MNIAGEDPGSATLGRRSVPINQAHHPVSAEPGP
jgi:hypothetical protein